MGDGGVALILNTGGGCLAPHKLPRKTSKNRKKTAAENEEATLEQGPEEEEHKQTIVLFRVGAKE